MSDLRVFGLCKCYLLWHLIFSMS